MSVVMEKNDLAPLGDWWPDCDDDIPFGEPPYDHIRSSAGKPFRPRNVVGTNSRNGSRNELRNESSRRSEGASLESDSFLAREFLIRASRDSKVAESCAHFLGVDPDELDAGRNGCWGVFVDGEYLLLPELYARRKGWEGKIDDKPALPRWHARLLHEVGELELPQVELPSFVGAEDVLAVRRGLELLLRVRAFFGDKGPVPFTVRFGAAWSGVTQWALREGLRTLEGAGVIKRDGEMAGGPGRNPSPLWVPGVKS